MYRLLKVKGTNPVYAVRHGLFRHISPAELHAIRASGMALDDGAIKEVEQVDADVLRDFVMR